MKKTLVTIFIGLSVFLFLNKHYALVGFSIPFFNAPNGMVRVDFVNESDESIRSIVLIVPSVTITNIDIGERRSIMFEHSGEGTVDYVVVFNSGKRLNFTNYIEGGYFLTERIRSNGVESKWN